MERYNRAFANGLCPPPSVKEILEKHPNDVRFTEWYVCQKIPAQTGFQTGFASPLFFGPFVTFPTRQAFPGIPGQNCF